MSVDPQASAGVHTILLVDDDQELRDLISDLLEEEGYAVVATGDGKEALRYLAGGRAPVLILLDLMMPIVDGWTFLSVIRGDARLSRIPVVVMTASKRDRPDGAISALKKPFRISDLLDTVLRIARPAGDKGAAGSQAIH